MCTRVIGGGRRGCLGGPGRRRPPSKRSRAPAAGSAASALENEPGESVADRDLGEHDGDEKERAADDTLCLLAPHRTQVLALVLS